MYCKRVPETIRNHIFKKSKERYNEMSSIENINRYQVNVFMTIKYSLLGYIFYQKKIICIFIRCNVQVNMKLHKVRVTDCQGIAQSNNGVEF